MNPNVSDSVSAAADVSEVFDDADQRKSQPQNTKEVKQGSPCGRVERGLVVPVPSARPDKRSRCGIYFGVRPARCPVHTIVTAVDKKGNNSPPSAVVAIAPETIENTLNIR